MGPSGTTSFQLQLLLPPCSASPPPPLAHSTIAAMQVKIVKPGKKVRDFGAVSVEDGATVAQLKLAFEKATRISRFRQNFKLQQGETLVVRSALTLCIVVLPAT